MWGTGPCLFEDCVCRSLRSNAYYTQIRNPGTNHGYVYVNCVFDGTQGVMGNSLSRIGTGQFPNSEVVLIDCQVTSAVGPVAWLLQGRPGATGGVPAANVHFWEYRSHDAAGQPVDVSRRLRGSRQLALPADAELIASYRNPSFVLGNDWNPKAAPVFATALPVPAPSPAGSPVLALAPAGQIALLGTDPSFTVVATGDGPLRYQWSKDGTLLPDQTAATLRFQNLRWDDAANYTVTVSNAAGSVTSAAAQLTAVAPAAMTPPKLPAIPGAVFVATAYGAVADGQTDNAPAIQKAIAAALKAGGGNVVVPAGAQPYLCGPLTLGSLINLQIDRGATLQLLPLAAKAAPAVPAYPDLGGGRYADFISAANAHDVAVTGGGTIDGQGAAWWRAFMADHAMPHRPFLVRFNHCNTVLISGITLMNSPMFHVATSGTDNLTVFGLTISAPVSPNTDGVDPSGSHLLIQNCHIAVGDDNVVMKPGGSFCSDITVADCYFGIGHGMSVGGQSNAGLDGMTVKNCYFNGTTSGLRLKADATQGGPVQNITYTNLVMENVEYPIVFYSYYNKVGSPGTVTGRLQSTPEKVKLWNATPPNSLSRRTLPSWKHIAINGLTATGTTGYSTIWGLPLAGYFWDDVKLNNVFISGGPGLEIYDAGNVQFTGDTQVGALTTCNALALTSQPRSQMAPLGSAVTFSVTTAGTGGVKEGAPSFQWSFNGAPLADGPRPDGAIVSGTTTATLKLDKIQAGEAGKYAVTVSNSLDAYNVAAKALAPGSAAVSATSSVATLNQAPPSRFGY
jgi:polygalacturonase